MAQPTGYLIHKFPKSLIDTTESPGFWDTAKRLQQNLFINISDVRNGQTHVLATGRLKNSCLRIMPTFIKS